MEQIRLLSRREREVTTLLLQGKSNKQIALSLGVSERTVEFHLKNIYAKLQVNSRVELILKLGKTTGGIIEKLGESTVDVLDKSIHNGKQSVRNRWTQPLKNIIFTAQKEFATMKNIIWEDVRNFIKMNINAKRVLFWTPRVLCILFAAFLSMFALDVFSEAYSFGETIIALLIHLIPTLIVVIVLAITWRRDWVGTILFTVLAFFYVVWSKRFDWALVISGPLLLIGILFLLNWIYSNNGFRRIA
jgi:DNA-binding CsgD family transcriptional regulator